VIPSTRSICGDGESEFRSGVDFELPETRGRDAFVQVRFRNPGANFLTYSTGRLRLAPPLLDFVIAIAQASSYTNIEQSRSE